ncbi:MAG: prolyl oligopeptidase family serine peptidase [Lentisphaerae bacterium]|nr:prolyl oligopeptidase family serine peptidase [Lentisphaerota bacterium]
MSVKKSFLCKRLIIIAVLPCAAAGLGGSDSPCGLGAAQHADRARVGIVAVGAVRGADDGRRWPDDRALAVLTVRHLRKNLKNAALLEADALMSQEFSADMTPVIVVFAGGVGGGQTSLYDSMTEKLVAYRKRGGKIIWVGAGLPDRRFRGFPEHYVESADRSAPWLAELQKPLADGEEARVSLQAGAWPARAAAREPGAGAWAQVAGNVTRFKPGSEALITPLIKLRVGDVAHTVGGAWPKSAPTVAYLPVFAVCPGLWSDDRPPAPEASGLDAQGFESLDVAFAALHGPALPPSAFTPPAEYAGVSEDHRSPLLFADGAAVREAAEWPRRRREILSAWHSRMGEWPPLLTNQNFQVTASVKCEGFTRHHVRFNWLPGESTDGYLLVPDRSGKKPAVITLYYEPETAAGMGGGPYRDFALQLARRGFVALSIGTREASKRREYALYWPDVREARVQPLSMLAYAAANAYQALAKEASVDPGRVGVMGHSFGGKWAMFASCLYDRFACGVWSDPGVVFGEDSISVNYWEPWYLGYHPKPWRERGLMTPENPGRGLYLKLREEGLDLTDLHALMAPRPFLVSGGAEDPPGRWKALGHAIRVNALLGATNRVAMTNRLRHAPCAESNEQIYRFLEQALRP